MFDHVRTIHSDHSYALVMRHELYELIDAKTGARVHLVWPQMCNVTPVGRETLDDGSVAVAVHTIQGSEGRSIEVFWIYPFTSRVHKWIVDSCGVRQRGEWLTEHDARDFVARRWRTSPEWLYRQLLNLRAQGLLSADLVEVEAVKSPEVSTSVELAAFVAGQRSVFSRQLYLCARTMLRETLIDFGKSIRVHNERRLIRILEPIEQLLRGDPEIPREILAQPANVAMRIRQNLLRIEVDVSAQAVLDNAKFYFGPDQDCSIFSLGLATTFWFRLPSGLKTPMTFEIFSETRNPSPRLYEGMAYLYHLRSYISDLTSDGHLEVGKFDDVEVAGSFQAGDAGKDCDSSFAYQGHASDQKTILIPDAYFFASHGYAKFRQQLEATPFPWVDRRSAAVWRGSTTGSLGPHNKTSMAFLDTLPRYQLCKLGVIAGTLADFGFTGVAAPASDDEEAGVRARLQREGLWRLPMAQVAMQAWKFQIDIDGHANAWGLFQKLLMASCVIKVGSSKGCVQWYYSELQEWQHFVPVRSDMSDLVEKLEWCASHDDQAQAIGRRGRDFALARTFESEMKAAAESIFGAGQVMAPRLR